jgi:threonine/homoserine/homoserine lactone efflux protein
VNAATGTGPGRHALRVVGLGIALGVLLYVGYLALGMLP